LMIFEPPRHGKTELASRRLPALALGQDPDAEVMVCSYSADLASRINRDAQRIIDSPSYRELFPGTRLAGGKARQGQKSQRTDDLFEIVGRRGSLRTAGVGGGITGMGFSLGIIDDPLKNSEEASSPTIREKVWEWYTSTFYTRRAPGARILLTTTRWHQDDLAGRLLRLAAEDPQADQWHVLSFPAIADDGCGAYDWRSHGEALWPERFDLSDLEKTRATLGSYQWAAMYQQRPTPAGGNLFRAEWFQRYRNDGEWWDLGIKRAHKPDATIYVTCDPAASEKETSDYTAIVVCAVTPANDMLILEVVRERLGVEGIVPRLVSVCNRWSPAFVGVEASGFQSYIVRAARQTPGLPPIREISHEGKGKLPRATPAIIKCEGGQVYIPQQADWVKPFVDECCQFTGQNDLHDDQVDAFAYAVLQMPSVFRDAVSEPDVGPHRTMRPEWESNASRGGLWGRS
jgi:predicted phage terminase large subunit-like protein